MFSGSEERENQTHVGEQGTSTHRTRDGRFDRERLLGPGGDEDTPVARQVEFVR